MGEATRWVSVTGGTPAVLAAVADCVRETGAMDPDDVTVSVQADGDGPAGYRVHAVYVPSQRGPIDR